MKKIELNALDRVEILTLQDNTIDITMMANNAIVQRAMAIKEGQIKNSILAEHGFSALVRTTAGEKTRTLLFDFGYSEEGAAFNARALGVDMGQVEALALSHGHSDHMGGFAALVEMIGKKGLPFFVHPGIFKAPRYVKFGEGLKFDFPTITRAGLEQAGVKVIEARGPETLLDGDVGFLGEIERVTDFEKGFPIAFFQEDAVEKWDPIEDDTAVVMNLKGKGLVVLSGCAHSGVVNTVRYAKAVTGIEKVHAIMGGFHLSGPFFEPIVGRTTEELQKLAPDYIIPTHCTGRKAIMYMENAMPGQFILNMSGTKLTFAA
ncbi:MAG: MBL fold metallo-hydrolase [Deltaproteobacteria bacterium]|nr:MBL fold metallo-hydrolase [Deltaproteobacteria bacterium]